MKIYEAHPRLKDERELKIWSLERAIASSLLEGMEEAVKPLEEELQQIHRHASPASSELAENKAP
mgnify:CR=1 FL=1